MYQSSYRCSHPCMQLVCLTSMLSHADPIPNCMPSAFVFSWPLAQKPSSTSHLQTSLLIWR